VRYFFHLDDGLPNNDIDAVDLPDLEAVQAEASKVCGEMLADAGLGFWTNPDWRVRVKNEAGELVLSISIRGEGVGEKASS
jgi:hypothetical protein